MKTVAEFVQSMRRGAMMGVQVFGDFFGTEDAKSSCALGAVFMAEVRVPQIVRVDEDDYENHTHTVDADEDEVNNWLDETYPWISSPESVKCPAETCEYGHHTLKDIIIHLNDQHKWMREAIADWVKSKAAEIEVSNG